MDGKDLASQVMAEIVLAKTNQDSPNAGRVTARSDEYAGGAGL
jgi:hypothetical protein